jgi:hypothetical protein
VVVQVLPARNGMPETNDLVRVTLGGIDGPDAERYASEVPSRIEDAAYDRDTGRPLGYRIAAPWFTGDLEVPAPQTECALQWVSPQGLWTLPCAFEAQEVTPHGLRVWRVRVTGEPCREERRRYVRVEWSVPADLAVRRRLGTLPPQARRRAEEGGVRTWLAALPDRIGAEIVNVSEGGLRCFSAVPVLPQGLPLVVTFTLDDHPFETTAHVIWSLFCEGAFPERAVESALAFDDPTRHAERLRPLMFAAQLRAWRAGLV